MVGRELRSFQPVSKIKERKKVVGWFGRSGAPTQTPTTLSFFKFFIH